jgi:hypothetical protein
VLCVRVFLKETCVEKKREKKEMEFPVRLIFLFMCLWLFRFLCRLFFFFCELLLCSKLCFLFFFYAATITAAAAVFLYLFIKRLCVCVCQLLLSAVCLRACEQFTHFILLFSVFSFRLLKKLPNLFTT